jgi:DNA-binding beta-propeller fold protein YncE
MVKFINTKHIGSIMPFTLFHRFYTLLFTLFFGLLSTSAQTAPTFQPDAMWPKTTQSGKFFNRPTGIAHDKEGRFYIVDTGSHKIKVLTANGELLRAWGGFGNEPGEFYEPIDIALTSSGDVVVIDRYTQRIQVFNSEGQYIRHWDTIGFTNGLAIDNQDHIFVSFDNTLLTNEDNNIQIFDLTGHKLKVLGEGIVDNPYGMAFSPSGELYVAEVNNHRISIFSTEGRYLRSIGEKGTESGQFNEPNNLTFDAQGLLYISDTKNNRIQVFDVQDQFIREWSGEFDPHGLAIDNQNNVIYVVDTASNRIRTFSLQGNDKETWQSQSNKLGEFSAPHVSVGSDGNIYVADTGNHRIQVFSATGTRLVSVGEFGDKPGQFSSPRHIAFDQQHYIYIADSGNNRIQVFDKQGKYIRQFGSSNSREHQLNKPVNLFIHENLIYISNEGNDRIQVFTLDGQWVRGWGGTGSEAGLFNNPRGIVVDERGVFIADYGNKRIQFFNHEGDQYEFMSEGEALYSGIALSPTGLLYITDTLNNRIIVLDQKLKTVEEIGSAGTQTGQFGQPTSLALIDEDTLVVGEQANNRIQVLRRRDIAPTSHKAIILAGGGSPTDTHFNALWDSTQLLSNNAYFALRAQGYNKEAIKFLSSGNLSNDLDENGKADDLESATLASLEQSITTWASDAKDVLIYLVDHGGPGTFKVNQKDILSREQLKQWIDSLQSKTNGKVTVIIEACQSASFFDGLGANNRILIASADKEQPAVISNQGMNSFSYHFWYAVHTGQPLLQAFKKAQQGMSSQAILVNNKEQRQKAQLEADGNGLFDSADETAVGDYCLGNCQQLAADEPQLTPITTSSTLNGETKFSLSVLVTSLAPISRSWAIISRPDVNHTDLNQPISDLPQLSLLCTKQETGQYLCQGEYPAFDVNGDYNITFYARDTQARTSVPNTSITIKQTAGKGNTLSSSKYSTLYDTKTGKVTLQDVEVDGQHYRVNLQSQNDLFMLTSAESATQFFEIPAQFTFTNGLLAIPQVEVNGHIYSANLQKQLGEGFVFKLNNVIDFGISP